MFYEYCWLIPKQLPLKSGQKNKSSAAIYCHRHTSSAKTSAIVCIAFIFSVLYIAKDLRKCRSSAVCPISNSKVHPVHRNFESKQKVQEKHTISRKYVSTEHYASINMQCYSDDNSIYNNNNRLQPKLTMCYINFILSVLY